MMLSLLLRNQRPAVKPRPKRPSETVSPVPYTPGSPKSAPHSVQGHALIIAHKPRRFQVFAALGRGHRLIVPFIDGEFAADIERFIAAKDGGQAGDGGGDVFTACASQGTEAAALVFDDQ